MDKKEIKRINAVFANMMKEVMNTPANSLPATLHRDIHNFIYGRTLTLIKQNHNQPICSIADLSAIVGMSLGEVLNEFLASLSETEYKEFWTIAQDNLANGLNATEKKFEQVEQMDVFNDTENV